MPYKASNHHLRLETQARYRIKNKELLRKKVLEYSRRPEVLEREREKRRTLYYQAKQEIFDYYGRICVCCGETIPKFLTIDHVNNDGKRHRNGINRFSQMLKEIKQGYGSRFQVLCMNCNWGKKMNDGKYCPHKETN